jgi:glycosyltransferase involved in cell wall biosynthesis
VLDAAQVLLQRNRKDIVLVFIGDGKLKPDLVKRATIEGLHNCRFFDPMPKTRLSRVLGCCDIGLMILDDVPAFYYGTSPNKFFDYLSAGLPVVNNYPGWLAELIREYRCGEPVPSRNPELLADSLCRLADDLKLRKMYGKNARKLAEGWFSRGKLAKQFVGWLEKCAEGK